MNKFQRENIAIALAAVIGIPLLLLWQQQLMPRVIYFVPPQAELQVDHGFLSSTESALEYGRDNARHTARAAAAYLERGDFRMAENWLRLGAAEFRYPSMMLFYGDFLVRTGRFREARRWYKLAFSSALAAGEGQFASFVADRLIRLDALEKKR